ncbi:hypothetical protein [Synechococcus phage BUCT-ZZ01]|nr:hypothetical protein [Synechococcus phage BUCT-ZZ01]
MADKKISEFTPATTIGNLALFPFIESGLNKIASLAILNRFIRPFMFPTPNAIPADDVLGYYVAPATVDLGTSVNDGQLKTIVNFSGTGDVVFTTPDGVGFDTITLSNNGDSVTLVRVSQKWVILCSHNAIIV